MINVEIFNEGRVHMAIVVNLCMEHMPTYQNPLPFVPFDSRGKTSQAQVTPPLAQHVYFYTLTGPPAVSWPSPGTINH